MLLYLNNLLLYVLGMYMYIYIIILGGKILTINCYILTSYLVGGK